MDLIKSIVSEQPKLHASGTTSWATSEDVVRQIKAYVKSGFNTIETGCGLSTIVFALCGCRHVCVTPSQDEAQRVRDLCNRYGIDTSGLRFCIGSSATVLATHSFDQPLDFIFIDGAHRFPYPILDFHYTEQHLRLGGILAVDDANIPTVAILCDFLKIENEWDEECSISGTEFFRKLGEPIRSQDWMGQRTNAGQVFSVPQASYARRIICKARRVIGRLS